MRRIVFAVIVCICGWVGLGSVAGADKYPPTPVVKKAPTPVVVHGVSPVIVVKGAPTVTPRGTLTRTGASETLPLVALATGSVLLGATLIGVGRRRRAAA